ncbi:MAG: intermembrane transport protein PqiB [Gammaproteobacteria bacterium]
MTNTSATVKPGRKLTGIWVIPILAALLGLWMVIYNQMNQGPEITISFDTATGIEAGKTKIKSLDVELGVVLSVELSQDMKNVIVTAQLEKFAEPLLREDTQFWVVRPRVGPGGISGLGTILSGGYIKLEDGVGKRGQTDFIGLDTPPVTPAGAPGLKILLESDRAGSVSTGDPILFRGYQVGTIEKTIFDLENQKVTYAAFIEEPYDQLICGNTRFWNASGIDIRTSTDGLDIEVNSLQSILVGGVAFSLPEGVSRGGSISNDQMFRLYSNRQQMEEKFYDYGFKMVIPFAQSISGLEPGAPVEYRGIRVGTVDRLMLEELAGSSLSKAAYGAPIPVLIRFEAGRFGLPDTQESADAFKATIGRAVRNGLRATLISGNLITGKQVVAFDYYPDAEPADLEEYFGYPAIPSLPGGIQRIQDQINSLLTKLNDLPLEPAVEEMQATLQELSATLDSVSPDSDNGTQVNQSLQELNRTLRNIDMLTRQLAEKPNSIIFSPPVQEDPVPEVGESE